MLAGRLAILRQDHRQPLFLVLEDVRPDAENALDLRPDIAEAPRVGVPGVGHDVGRLDEMPEAPLALLERQLGSPAVADVESDARDVADGAVAVPDRRPDADP